MGDLLGSLQKKHGVDPDAAWEGLVAAWRRHLGSLKLAFRMFCLLESPEADPRDMNLTQFRRFIEEAKLKEACRACAAEVDLVWTRVNRVVDATGGGAVATQAAKLASRLGAKSAAVRTDKMGEDGETRGSMREGA